MDSYMLIIVIFQLTVIMGEPEINLGKIIQYSKLIQMKGKIILLSKCMVRWKQNNRI